MSADSHRAADPDATDAGELGTTERWISTVAGAGLAMSAVRGQQSVLARVLLASAGLSLLARGATGFCAVKSAAAGQMTLVEGIKEELSRLTAAVTNVREIDTMESLYAAELQELHSAERQFAALLQRVGRSVQNQSLALRVDDYATELQSRKLDLEMLLARIDADRRAHPDDAMRALLSETEKMTRVRVPELRDAAVTASIQRIIHYKVAGYGAIASYAKALGRTEQAGYFAELANRDKKIDADFTQLAKKTLNPDATNVPIEHAVPPSVRTH